MDATSSAAAATSSSAAAGEKKEGDNRSNNNQTTTTSKDDEAVTVCVAYKVKATCFIQFEEWVHEIARTAATRSKGHRGCVVIEKNKTENKTNSSRQNPNLKSTHVIVFQYDSKEHLQAWTQHPARKQLVARLQPLLEPNTLTHLQVIVYDSFTDIADHHGENSVMRGISRADDSNDVDSVSASTLQSNRITRNDPQMWKVCFVIIFGLFVIIWFFGRTVIGPWVKTWGIPNKNAEHIVGTMFGTFLNVAMLTYVGMPVLVPLCSQWLHEPWHESECCFGFISLFQRGFECFDTVGKSLRAENKNILDYPNISI